MFVHQKLNGTESQRTPFSKLLDSSYYDTQVFSGSVDRGSCWRFLGLIAQSNDFWWETPPKMFGREKQIMFVIDNHIM